MTAVTDLHPCGGLRVLDGMAVSWGEGLMFDALGNAIMNKRQCCFQRT